MKKRHRVQIADLHVTAPMRDAVNRVLDSGRLSYGPESRAFEIVFARMHGCRHGVFLASGTCALHVALLALKIRNRWSDGARVIVPAVTFPATVNAVRHAGLTPVFVDVDRDTFTLDPEAVKRADLCGAVAILPVHLLGLPADMLALSEVADTAGLTIVEDACESIAVKAYGKSVGSWGAAGCFSTYVAHHLTTGVGGMIVTSDLSLASLARQLMAHGRDPAYLTSDDGAEVDEEAFREVIRRRFRFEHVGYSFRATEIEAALGSAQMEGMSSVLAVRRTIARKLRESLDGTPGLRFQKTPEWAEHSNLFFGLVLERGDRDRVLFRLESEGVETRDLFPLLDQPACMDVQREPCPVALSLACTGFLVGCHPGISESDVAFMAEAIRRIVTEEAAR